MEADKKEFEVFIKILDNGKYVGAISKGIGTTFIAETEYDVFKKLANSANTMVKHTAFHKIYKDSNGWVNTLIQNGFKSSGRTVKANSGPYIGVIQTLKGPRFAGFECEDVEINYMKND